MSEIEYEQCREEFVFDGSWRDIYIFNTSIDDWNAVLEVLSAYKHEYFIDGEPRTLPKPLDSNHFVDRHEYSCTLKSFYYCLQVNCHFFTDEMVELDIDPREVKDQASLDHLLAIMRLLGDKTNKDVVLTPENCEHVVIFRYIPRLKVVMYYPTTAGH